MDVNSPMNYIVEICHWLRFFVPLFYSLLALVDSAVPPGGSVSHRRLTTFESGPVVKVILMSAWFSIFLTVVKGPPFKDRERVSEPSLQELPQLTTYLR